MCDRPQWHAFNTPIETPTDSHNRMEIYVLTSQNGRESTFEFNPNYEQEANKQYPVIIEEYYRSSSDAVDAPDAWSG